MISVAELLAHHNNAEEVINAALKDPKLSWHTPRSNTPFPAIELFPCLCIVDGRHRIAAAVLRGTATVACVLDHRKNSHHGQTTERTSEFAR